MSLKSPKLKSAPEVVDTSTLADYLGLSRWTVSRVLNDQPGVKAATRERVLKSVKELGFSPNMQARRLKGVPTRLVGVVFQELEAPVLADKSAEVQRTLMRSGHRAVFEIAGGDPSMEIDAIRHFLSIGVDGIVLIGSKMTGEEEIFEMVRQRGVAIIGVDAREKMGIPSIELDRATAMILNINHLFEKGHRRFALLGIRSDDMYLSRRVRGIRKSLEEKGLNWDESIFELWDSGKNIQSPDYGYDLGERLLNSDHPPRAIIALNDRIAMGVMQAIREKGKRIPEDFSIIGFDNLEESAWLSPPLTSIDQNVSELIDIAGQHLFKVINGEKVPMVTKIKPRLVERNST